MGLFYNAPEPTRDHAAKMQTRDYTDNFEFQYNRDENMAELSYINFTEHSIAYLYVASLVPRTWTFQLSSVGGRAFPVAGPTIWYSLPDNVISAPSLSTFRQRLRTFLFQASFPDIIIDPR